MIRKLHWENFRSTFLESRDGFLWFSFIRPTSTMSPYHVVCASINPSYYFPYWRWLYITYIGDNAKIHRSTKPLNHSENITTEPPNSNLMKLCLWKSVSRGLRGGQQHYDNHEKCLWRLKHHGVWKSQKKSHSTLRAKRATFTSKIVN